MKKVLLRVILIILLIVNFWTIFGFSNQNGEESSGISRKLTIAITNNIEYIQQMDIRGKEVVLNKIETVIRKLAHLTIYTIQGILMMGLMYTFEIQQKYRVAISLGVGIIYAISDEIHQGFVPGRSPHITDVMIDTAGVVIGITVIILLLKFTKKCSKKSEKCIEK